VAEFPPPLSAGLKSCSIRSELERFCADVRPNGDSVIGGFDIDVPALPGGQPVEAPVGDEGSDFEIDRSTAPQEAVRDEGCVGPVDHPDATLDERVRDRERPDRQRPFQAKRFEIAVSVRQHPSSELVGRQGIPFAVVTHPVDRPGNEHGSLDRRIERRHQEPVVGAGERAGDRRGCVPTQPVRHQPFPRQTAFEIAGDLPAERDVRVIQNRWFSRPGR
jgi:hypothetical protein